MKPCEPSRVTPPRERACCTEADCHRAKPFLFTKTPDDRWLLVTRYQYVNDAGDTVMIKDLSAGVRVLERHDVTEQINNILIQYRAWLDQELVEAMTRAAAPKLILPGES